jgi:hypothetical protein
VLLAVGQALIVGRLARLAELILIEGNPLEDVSSLQRLGALVGHIRFIVGPRSGLHPASTPGRRGS